MKVVPVTSAIGVQYLVAKRTFFGGTRHLCKNAQWADPSGSEALYLIREPMRFNTVADAVCEIRKQFGESQEIQEWVGS